MTEVSIALGVLLGFTLVWIILAYIFNKGNAGAPKRGMGLPRGSIRSIIAVWVIGAFIVFVFFGRDALAEAAQSNDTSTDDIYEKVLVSFTTLVAAISGFYFGARTGQRLESPSEDEPTTDEDGSSSSTGTGTN
jgi:hypothetical protein